jgi:hypothetical protein
MKEIHYNGFIFYYDPERPFVRFLGGGPSKPDIPPLPDPTPTPEDINLQAVQKGAATRRRLRSKKGREGTILTESNLGSAQGRSPILGTVGVV